ncbi:MAG: (2Fe-2S) ferredoxin domain-containing protein, partial [Sphaerochaetaceae bacterium]|nr:(2Fe-2S) ferredoxin domain-containing protein [Sphaerochaetaceae bacterium]
MDIRDYIQLEKESATCTKCFNDKLAGEGGKRAVLLCGGTGCLSSHSNEIKEEFQKQIEAKGLQDKISVNQVGCFGFCSQGPFVKIYPEDTLYRLVKI